MTIQTFENNKVCIFREKINLKTELCGIIRNSNIYLTSNFFDSSNEYAFFYCLLNIRYMC